MRQGVGEQTALLLKRAGFTTYAVARRVDRMAGERGQPALSSGPEVVARKIVKAATARRPKARYSTGKGASTVMTARRALPDRAFDAIMTRMYIE